MIDDHDELQPDAHLRVLPDYGGQTRKSGKLIAGCPELVLEVAESSRNYDLGPKLRAYEDAGALEYIVLAIDPDEILWHTRDGERLVRIAPNDHGIYRSTRFPGLWLDSKALFAEDALALLATLELGLASPEHADFVKLLEARKNQGRDS